MVWGFAALAFADVSWTCFSKPLRFHLAQRNFFVLMLVFFICLIHFYSKPNAPKTMNSEFSLCEFA